LRPRLHSKLLEHLAGNRRSAEWDAVDIYRIDDAGKISEQWAFEDFAAILSQAAGVKLPWAW
jgi:predicted SnoaL-like aldol condensation-catalyzing enzyme